MIVPQYWAEGRLRERSKRGGQVTIRRFGWSNTSQAEAQAMADERTRAAMERVSRGETVLLRREPKVAYNGAEGVPIREEILSRHGEVVITRNLYGARCLNTPNVLFADVDFESETPFSLGCAVTIVLILAAVAIGVAFHSKTLVIVLAIISGSLGHVVAAGLQKFYHRLRGGPDKLARQRLASFLRSHPDWNVRLYRTPAGFRLLAMHRPFHPDEPAVAEFFAALGTDPVYVQMCLKQKCFRARLTPKPWRIGISQHLRPRPGVWPLKPEHLPLRQRWVQDYEAKAHAYAACEFLEDLGSGVTHDATRAVQRLHDDISRATSGLKIA